MFLVLCSGMIGFRIALAAVFLLAALPRAGALHDLKCRPGQSAGTDEKTGVQKCLSPSPAARRQTQRYQRLQRDQAQRTRELLQQQQQRTKDQELIAREALNKQQQFTRGLNTRQ